MLLCCLPFVFFWASGMLAGLLHLLLPPRVPKGLDCELGQFCVSDSCFHTASTLCTQFCMGRKGPGKYNLKTQYSSIVFLRVV